MSRYVLSNSDLTRQIIASASRPVELLQTSKSIRTAQAPCAELYEQWSNSGCPQHPTGVEATCLNGLDGGVDSVFCQGVFTLVVEGKRSTGVGATSVVHRLTTLIQSPQPGTLVIVVGMGPTILKLQADAQSRPILVVTEDGWRKKGSNCTVSRQQAVQVLTELLTRTGTVTLPCPARTSAPSSIHVTRKLQVTARLTDLTHDRVLFSAVRK
jgi:hypothetical protein